MFSGMPRPKAGQKAEGGRTILTLALAPQVKEIARKWKAETGGSQTELVRRVLEWFAGAPDSIRQTVLGAVPSDMKAEYRKRISDYFNELLSDESESDELPAGMVLLDAIPGSSPGSAKAGTIPSSPGHHK
jgi:hypothetical protein